jgi:hypothetical protein
VQWWSRTYELEGRSKEAISEFKRFLANFPDHPNAPDADDRIRDIEKAMRPKPKKAVSVVGTLSTDYEYGKDFTPDPLVYLNRITTRLDAQVRNLEPGKLVSADSII